MDSGLAAEAAPRNDNRHGFTTVSINMAPPLPAADAFRGDALLDALAVFNIAFTRCSTMRLPLAPHGMTEPDRARRRH